jgi:hypothetical protein
VGAKPTYRSTARFVLESVEGLIVATVVLGTWFVSKRWLADWGSTPAERSNKWPGDSLAPAGVEFYTRAIDVAAPAAVVWQWVVQFGLDRAGFYSYELLERLVGIPVRNVEAILPEYQDLAVGSQIKLHPTAPGVPVGLIEHGSHVCFGEAGEVGPNTPDPRRSWSMYVRSESPGRCRLVLRTRLEGLRSPTLVKRVGLALDAPIDFVMEQRMLRTIRRLAESSA